MLFQGQILKMSTVLTNPVEYYLNLSGDLLNMNQLIHRNLHLKHIGYACVDCGKDEKIYRMGFCKKCFFESPYASESIIRPELSKAHLGEEERDLEIEIKIQLQPHIVYLAYTGDVKVGVTRESQIPTRWIDQGATLALPIAKTDNRYEAGVIEVALKNYLADKTNYKKMLNSEGNSLVDLAKIREEIKKFFPVESQKFYLENAEILAIHYPYSTPEKINSFTLEKNPEFSGNLKGIKGQYLCFDTGNFINIRNHEGFVIELEIL
jgi:hypothetical protein